MQYKLDSSKYTVTSLSDRGGIYSVAWCGVQISGNFHIKMNIGAGDFQIGIGGFYIRRYLSSSNGYIGMGGCISPNTKKVYLNALFYQG